MTLDDLRNINIDDFKRIGTAPLPLRIGTIVVIVIAIFLGGFFQLVDPQFDIIKDLEAKEEKLKETFDKEQRKAANLEAYTEQLDEMNRTFGAMIRRLPDKQEVENLIVELSQTSAANGLLFSHLKPTGEITKEFYAEYPIEIHVSGKFHELAKFVSDVAALSRIVTLHDISISAIDAEKPTELIMQMTAKTYRYLEEENT